MCTTCQHTDPTPTQHPPSHLESNAAALAAPVEDGSPAVATIDGCIYLDAQQVNRAVGVLSHLCTSHHTA